MGLRSTYFRLLQRTLVAPATAVAGTPITITGRVWPVPSGGVTLERRGAPGTAWQRRPDHAPCRRAEATSSVQLCPDGRPRLPARRPPARPSRRTSASRCSPTLTLADSRRARFRATMYPALPGEELDALPRRAARCWTLVEAAHADANGHAALHDRAGDRHLARALRRRRHPPPRPLRPRSRFPRRLEQLVGRARRAAPARARRPRSRPAARRARPPRPAPTNASAPISMPGSSVAPPPTRAPAADGRALDQRVAALGAAHEVVVGGDDARGDEDVLLERAVRGDVGVRLDLRVGADRGVVLDAHAAADHDVCRRSCSARAPWRGRRRRSRRRASFPPRARRPAEIARPGAEPQRRELAAAGGRAGREHRPAAEHGVVADARSRRRRPCPRGRSRSAPKRTSAPIWRPRRARGRARRPPATSPRGRSERDRLAAAVERRLHRLEHLDHPQALVDARRARPSPSATACRKWLHSSCSGSRRSMRGTQMSPVCVEMRPAGVCHVALVVDRHLAVGLHVVEHRHLARADHGHLAHLVRVEPGQVQVADLAASRSGCSRRRRPRRPAGRSACAARPHLDRVGVDQVQDDRDVVHAERPEHVLVRRGSCPG